MVTVEDSSEKTAVNEHGHSWSRPSVLMEPKTSPTPQSPISPQFFHNIKPATLPPGCTSIATLLITPRITSPKPYRTL